MKKKRKKNGSFLQSIRARVLLMGTVAILVSAVLGVVGILSLRANNRNQEILAQINQINLYQYENDSLETDYLHYLKEQYLDHINANLSAMGASVSHAKKTAGNAYRDEFSSVEEAIASSRENYAALSEISASRGYSAGKGEYQHFLAPDEALAEGFLSLPADDGQYDFSQTLATMDNDFASYSKRVVEGTATASESESIRTMLTEMAQKLDASLASAAQKEELLGLIGQKQEAFASMAAMDQEVLVLKQENNTLQDQLTEVTGSVRSQIETETQQNQRNLILLITVILAAGTVMLILMTLYIGKSISVSMKVFKQTLSQMTDGNLGVRAKVRGKDEFSQFSISINAFLDRLAEVIKNAQEISLAVRQSGEHLDDMAANSSMTSEEIKRAVKEISSGAATQAGESDSAAGQIEEMGKSFGLIVENVEHLGSIAAEMHRVSSEAAQFMQDLGDANEKTVHAFSQVASQTHSTNESVQKIREAAELITSIASQTNLLSLNASIEAARAGEAGKGFAVVATEIQHLSEQSNASADIIKQIIKEVSAQAELTVNVVDEVSEIVANQQHKLDMTKEHFAALEQKIQTSGSETEQIRRETDVCNTARLNVETVIMSLSAISEQNAASTEETTVSMSRLNGTIQQLVDASGELKEMAGQLENDLKFFHTGES